MNSISHVLRWIRIPFPLSDSHQLLTDLGSQPHHKSLSSIWNVPTSSSKPCAVTCLIQLERYRFLIPTRNSISRLSLFYLFSPLTQDERQGGTSELAIGASHSLPPRYRSYHLTLYHLTRNNVSDLSSEGDRFKSRPGHQTYCLEIFRGLPLTLSPRLAHNCFLPHPFQFIINLSPHHLTVYGQKYWQH
jgi:hypothetical protein